MSSGANPLISKEKADSQEGAPSPSTRVPYTDRLTYGDLTDEDAEGESDSLTAAPIQGARRPQAPIVNFEQPHGPIDPPLNLQAGNHDPPIPPPSTSAIARLGSSTAAPTQSSAAPQDLLCAPTAEDQNNRPRAGHHDRPAGAVDPSEPSTIPNIRTQLRDAASTDEWGYGPGHKNAERRAHKKRKQRLNWKVDVIGSASP